MVTLIVGVAGLILLGAYSHTVAAMGSPHFFKLQMPTTGDPGGGSALCAATV